MARHHGTMYGHINELKQESSIKVLGTVDEFKM